MRLVLGVLGVACGLLGALDLLGPQRGQLVGLPEVASAEAAGVPALGLFRAVGWLEVAAALLGAVGVWLARVRPARGWPLLLVAGLGLLPGPSLFALTGAVLLLLSAGLGYRHARAAGRLRQDLPP